MFEPETLAGHLGFPGTPEGRGVDGAEPETELRPEDPVTCRCGRTVLAMRMVRVDALPQAARGNRRVVTVVDGRRVATMEPAPDYLCDACIETAIWTGKFTRSEFARAVGAPADVIARFEEEERSR